MNVKSIKRKHCRTNTVMGKNEMAKTHEITFPRRLNAYYLVYRCHDSNQSPNGKVFFIIEIFFNYRPIRFEYTYVA